MEEKHSFDFLDEEQMKHLMHCMAVCRACAKMCIDEGHKKTASMCSECADVCDLAVKLKCCKSEFCDDILEVCSEACEKCGMECGKMKAEHCKECSEVCKECSSSCRSSDTIR